MSDNQLMMEHIIELNNQVNKLANKHKKLKKKYRALKHDIYEEDIEQENEIGLERMEELRSSSSHNKNENTDLPEHAKSMYS